MYWYSLFENNKQGLVANNLNNNSSSHLYSMGSSTAGIGAMMPLGNLSASGNIHQSRSESYQTLHGESLLVVGYSPQQPLPQHYQQSLHPLDLSSLSEAGNEGPQEMASPSSVAIHTLTVQEPQYLNSSQGPLLEDVQSQGATSGQQQQQQQQRDVEELEMSERRDLSPWP